MGQQYSVNTLGGYWSVPFLSEKIRSAAQPEFKLRQFADVKQEFGKGVGDTWNFGKTGNVLTQGGTLIETNTIPETSYRTVQGTGSVTEYGNSVPFTGKMESLGQFSVSAITEQKLKDDQVKVLESAAAAQFVATEFVAVCSQTNSVVFTTNGTATATATANLTAFNVRAIKKFMKKKLIPGYSGGDYMCVASVESIGGMMEDVASAGWVTVGQYTPTFAANIMNGEVGKYDGVRFMEETGYFSNAIGASSLYGQAVFFGSDCVYEAVVVPEEIRVKNSTDYGRDMGLAWYALLGFKKVWDYSVDVEQHIVFVTSA
jgi:N4-gp56 family major capsid protein